MNQIDMFSYLDLPVSSFCLICQCCLWVEGSGQKVQKNFLTAQVPVALDVTVQHGVVKSTGCFSFSKLHFNPSSLGVPLNQTLLSTWSISLRVPLDKATLNEPENQ
jgi:hypothetical protein